MRRQRLAFWLALWLFPSIIYPPFFSAQPTTSNQTNTATLRLEGLRKEVSIRRDERGIPYIEAADEADLYFAQGYATASDRLWQMDLLRRTGRGELSEIMGRDALGDDKFYRTFGFGLVAEAALRNASAGLRGALESYARGVNAFIDSCADKTLPIEFQILKYKPRPWNATDSLVIGKVLSVALTTTWRTDIMRMALSEVPQDKREALLPEVSPLDVVLVGNDAVRRKPAAKALSTPAPQVVTAHTLDAVISLMEVSNRSLQRIGLYVEELAASNNWVVSGNRTASGQPMLANDPHLAASAPSIWYMTHLSAPDLTLAGVAIPGVPGIIIGHNQHIAWGVTNLGADVQDLYLETFDSENQRLYKTPEGWREVEVRREEIKVRKSFSDSTAESVFNDVVITRHGPIIMQNRGKQYALRWTSLDSKTAQFEAFHLINRARNWNEFRAALKSYKEPAQNFVYADVGGHIGYYGAGEIPIRKTGDGSVPYDGSKDLGEWTGYIPFDKLPHLYDPPSGLIVTANNRIVGLDYPYVITHEWSQPYRARRILDLLQAKQKLTADDFQTIQADTYSFAGVIFAREVAKTALESANASRDTKWMDALRSLQSWKGHVDANSRGTVLLAEMRGYFRRRILEAALGPELVQRYSWINADTWVDRIVTERPREWLPKEFKDYSELFYAAYLDAHESLTKRLGPDESKWEWRFQPSTQVRFPHPLADAPFIGQRFKIEPFPQNGSFISLNSVNVGARVSMRFIADLSEWNMTRMGIALGQSGDPASPHWSDQLNDWREVTPRAFPFTRSAVAQAAKQTLVLAPVVEKR